MAARELSVEEVADRLGVNRDTVRRYLRTGKLRGYRLARRSGWRVLKSDLDAFIQERMNRAS